MSVRGLQFRSPASENGTVPPRRVKNTDRRPREYLTDREIEALMQVAKKRGRYGHRDATMLLVCYTHGLRVSELCSLRWDQVGFDLGVLHVRRRKKGIPSVQHMRGVEMRALRRLKRVAPLLPFVFVTERGSPMSEAGFRKMLARTAEASSIAFPVHPHMLRHSTGFKLANAGQDTRAIQHYLGHKNIHHTVRYTQLSPERFKNFWQD
jgi:type 1 fimbriae regulatory protein FimE